jgi:hypothetical protein
MVTVGLAGFLLLLGNADPAAARVETLRWSHDGSGNVSSYRIHWGTSPGSYPQAVETGLPSSSGGVFTFSVVVPDDTTVYFAVSAFDRSTGLRSQFSNERVRAQNGGGGTIDGNGGSPVLEPPNPSGPGLGPLPGVNPVEPSPIEPDPIEPDSQEELEEPAEPDERPLGAPGRPQVVGE